MDPDDKDLEKFWGEISGCTSLTLKVLRRCGCCERPKPHKYHISRLHHTKPNKIGFLLRQDGQEELNNHLTTICFIKCCFSNTNTIREILEFATELALLTSITSFWFTSCLLDTEQSMCLVRCLREERRSTVDVQIHCNNVEHNN